MDAKRRIEGHETLQPVVVKIFVGDIGDVHQKHTQEIATFLAALSDEAKACTGKRRQVVEPDPADFRRAALEEAFEDASLEHQFPAHGGKGFGLGFADASQLLAIGAAQDGGIAEFGQDDRRCGLSRCDGAVELEEPDHLRV